MKEIILSQLDIIELSNLISSQVAQIIAKDHKQKLEKKTYWEVKEAAIYFRVTERTIRRWLKYGKLPKHKIQGRVVIPIQEAIALINKRINS